MSQLVPTLVLLHGYLGSPALWDLWKSALRSDYAVWTPALPGHAGQSALAAGQSMEDLAQWALEGLDRHHPGTPAHWIGHSMGGYIALAILERAPDRVCSIGLVNSSPFADTDERKTLRLRAIETARAHRESYVRTTVRGLFDSEFATVQPEVVDRATEWGLEASLEGIVHSLDGMRVRSDRSDVLLHSGKPSLILHGQQDPVIGPETRQSIDRLSAEFRTHTLSHGHMGPLEAGLQGLACLKAFLEEA